MIAQETQGAPSIEHLRQLQLPASEALENREQKVYKRRRLCYTVCMMGSSQDPGRAGGGVAFALPPPVCLGDPAMRGLRDRRRLEQASPRPVGPTGARRPKMAPQAIEKMESAPGNGKRASMATVAHGACKCAKRPQPVGRAGVCRPEMAPQVVENMDPAPGNGRRFEHGERRGTIRHPSEGVGRPRARRPEMAPQCVGRPARSRR